MKTGIVALLIIALACIAARIGAETQDPVYATLGARLDLSRDRAPLAQRFVMESRMDMHAPDGAISSTDVYRLSIQCAPASASGTDGELYTCLDFTLRIGSGPELSIPSLKGWSYVYRHVAGAVDADGQTFGIPHKPFENLVDQNGKPIPAGNAYHVYNAFIDFHSLFFFVEPNRSGPGVQDLSVLGQRIVRAPAGATASTSVEGVTGKGSNFRNGEISLELKGLGVVNDRACAIVGYDAGNSSFTMIMNPMPNFEVRTVGSSHYHGDIFVDLATRWIQKASLTEMVVSETTVPGMDSKIHGTIERTIVLRNVTGAA